MFRAVSTHPLALAALALHAWLLESTRRDYERLRGRVASSGELLQLVAFDPAFAWLSPLTRGIDALQEGEPDAVASLAALLRRESVFRTRLIDTLQTEPEVVLAHARVQRQLAATTSLQAAEHVA